MSEIFSVSFAHNIGCLLDLIIMAINRADNWLLHHRISLHASHRMGVTCEGAMNRAHTKMKIEAFIRKAYYIPMKRIGCCIQRRKPVNGLMNVSRHEAIYGTMK